jgi:F0F1-type ATP synthase assembly protein I
VEQPSPFVRAGWYTALGINFSGTIAGGALVGWAIDRWLGSAPWALLTGTVLGLVGGLVWLVQALRRLERGGHEPEP